MQGQSQSYSTNQLIDDCTQNYSGNKGMDEKASHLEVNDSVSDCINRAVECTKSLSSEKLTGTGFFDDTVLFNELYKFLQALGKQAGYQIESVRDIKEALSSGQLTKQNIQSAYVQATGKSLDFHQISQRVGRTMRVLELVAQENYQMYQKLVQVSEKYLQSLNKARGETKDHEFRVMLDDMHREFEMVQRYIQFISQRQLKASYVPPAQDYTYDDQEKQLFTSLQKLQRVLKYCFASDKVLAQKFTAKMKQYAGKVDQQVYLMRLIQKSPLVLNSTQYTPAQIIDAFERAYEQIGNIQSKAERGQYLAKLLKITQKIMTEKMTDRLQGGNGSEPELIPQHRSIYQTLTHDAVVRDQRINVFKHRINHFYILIIKQFIQILDKKYYQDLAKMSQDLQLAVYELSEMQRELIDETENDIQTIISFLIKDENVTQLQYSNTIFRLKSVKQELEKRANELSGSFASVVNKIIDLFTNMIKFLDKTVKKGLQYSADDILDVEHYSLESLGDDLIKQQNEQNREWFAFITNYLTVFHMRQNLSRVKKELASIDEQTYYSKTTYKQLQQIYNECDKFYQQVDEFYTKQSADKQLKCDPVLAKYLYHVALRFQSSMFISKGRSTHPAINPRYFVFSNIESGVPTYNHFQEQQREPGTKQINESELNDLQTSAQKLAYSLFQHIESLNYGDDQFEADPYIPINRFYKTYIDWKCSSKFVGVSEELGAYKHKYDLMSIQDEGYDIPAKPESFKLLESKLDDTDNFQNTLYKNLKANPFLHNVISGNYLQARLCLQSLLYTIHRTGIKTVANEKLIGPTVADVDSDELKYAFLFHQLDKAQFPANLPLHLQKYLYKSTIDQYLQENEITTFTVQDFIYKLQELMPSPVPAQFSSVQLDLLPANTVQLDIKDDHTSWQNVVTYTFRNIFRLFGSQFKMLCDVADGPSADRLTFIADGSTDPDAASKLDQFDQELLSVDITQSRMQIAEQIYNIFTRIAIQGYPEYFAVPFNQLQAIPPEIRDHIKPKNSNVLVNYLTSAAPLLNQNIRKYICLSGLVYFPFYYAQDFQNNEDVPVTDANNMLQYRFADEDKPLRDVIFDKNGIDMKSNNQLVKTDITNNIQSHQSLDIYNILQRSSPQLLSQLLNQPQDSNMQSLEMLNRIIKLLKEQSIQDMQQNFVSCMSDENLKEYLMPQIQLPFINPTLQDAYLSKQNQMDSDELPALLCGEDHDSRMNYINNYRQILLAQYGRRVIVKGSQVNSGDPLIGAENAIKAGDTYSCSYQPNKRILFDSMYQDGSVKYTIQGKMAITPMFGSYLFMPILYQERRHGIISNKSEDIIKQAYWVKREYDSVLNCFFDQADRNTSRDYNTDITKMIFANKRNAIYFAIEQPQQVYDNQIDRQSSIFKSHTNAFFEYQLFMAQQLQYFTVHGCKFIFDPVVRKQIFEVSNKIYRGLPLFKYDFTSISRNNEEIKQLGSEVITYIQTNAAELLAASLVNSKGNNNAVVTREKHINAIIAMLKYPELQQQVQQIILKTIIAPGSTDVYLYYLISADKLNELQQIIISVCDQHAQQTSSQFRETVTKQFGQLNRIGNSNQYHIPRGFYPITDDYINNQPRLALGVVLGKSTNSQSMIREQFIDACLAKDQQIIQSDVLKINSKTFEKLLQVLREDEQKQKTKKFRFRVYLSECIRLQYHANACVLEQTEPIIQSVSTQQEYTLEEFQTLLKRVIRIKKRGYKALLQLAEQVDKMLSVELRSYVSSNLKFNDLRSILDKLMLHSRTQQEPEKIKEGIIAQCMNVNQYLSIYGKQNPFNSVYRQKNKLLGKGAYFKNKTLYKYDLVEYYKAITTYIDTIEKEIQQDENIENFAKLFTHIYQHSDDEYVKKMNTGDIRKFIAQYLISSAIDVDSSVLETDFAIEKHEYSGQSQLQSLLADQQYDESIIKQETTQFEFKNGQKMQLIGIDAIFVPQNWQVSSQNQQTTLVPRSANQCTQELDFLYNNIMNAMAQKLVNTLNLYKLHKYSKKQQDDSILLPRILLGSGKRRNKSQSRVIDDIGFSQMNKNEFDSKRIELYYRTYLLCYYYFNFFEIEEQKISGEDRDRLSSPVLLILKPNTDCPEGELLHFLFKLFRKSGITNSTLNLNNQQINELIQKIDNISNKTDSSESYSQVFNRLVEYINKNYGIVSVRENEQYKKLIKDLEQNSKSGKFSVQEVYDRLRGVPEQDQDNTMIRLQEEESDPIPYIDANQIKIYLDNKIDKLQKLLKIHHNKQLPDFQSENLTLSRIFRNVRLEFKNQSREQKINKLRHLIGGHISGFKGDLSAPIQIHERVMFCLEVIKQLQTLANVYVGISSQIATTGDSFRAVLERSQLAHVFNFPELIDIFPMSKQASANKKEIDFKYRYDFNGIKQYIEKLQLYLINTVKRNKSISNGIVVQVDGMEVKLLELDDKKNLKSESEQIFIKWFNETIKNLLSVFNDQIQEPFVEKLTNDQIDESQKQYQNVIDGYYGEDKKQPTTMYNSQTGEIETVKKYKEFISQDPVQSEFIIETDKGQKEGQPTHWTSYVNDKITNHALISSGSESIYRRDLNIPSSVVPVAPGIPLVPGAPKRVIIKPKGIAADAKAFKDGIIEGNAVLYSNDGYNPIYELLTKKPSQNVKDLLDKIAKMNSENTINDVITPSNKKIQFQIKEFAIQNTQDYKQQTAAKGAGWEQPALHKDSIPTLDMVLQSYEIMGPTGPQQQKRILINAKHLTQKDITDFYTIPMVNNSGPVSINYLLILNKNYVASAKNGSLQVRNFVSQRIFVPGFIELVKGFAYGSTMTKKVKTGISKDIENYNNTFKLKFTDKQLHGGIINKHTKSLGANQLTYNTYDQYPNPTMQFNSIIKYLIQQTSVISSVPKAFAVMFQGIWSGVGSQQDYDMIVQYKQHHIDDYRASQALRVREKNYVRQVANPYPEFKFQIQSYNKIPQQLPIIGEPIINEQTNEVTINFHDIDLKAQIDFFNTFDTMRSGRTNFHVGFLNYLADLVQAAVGSAVTEGDLSTNNVINGQPCQNYITEQMFADAYNRTFADDTIDFRNAGSIKFDRMMKRGFAQKYGKLIIPVFNKDNRIDISRYLRTLTFQIDNIQSPIQLSNETYIWASLKNEDKLDEYRIQQQLLEGVLYDGFQVGMPLYTAQQVAMHNDKIFKQETLLRTNFTSSVLHFASQLLSETHLLEGEKQILDAGKIPILQHDTEVQIVSSSVYAIMQLETLISQIDITLKSLEILNLYGLDQQEREQFLKKINIQLSYLNQLKQTIIRFRDNLEHFVEKKKDSLQGLLCDTKHTEQGLVSNFYHAIQIGDIFGSDKLIKNYDTMEVIIYAKYMYERMQTDSKQMVNMFSKQFGQGIDISFLGEIEPLIWMIMQAKHRLKLSNLCQYAKEQEALLIMSDERLDPKISVTNQSNSYVDMSKFPGIRSSYINPKAYMTGKVVRSADTRLDFADYAKIASPRFEWQLSVQNLPIQSLPEFQRNIQHTLPCRNQDIQRRIIEIITSGGSVTTGQNLWDINMIDIGILPINLNMIKKDVGLFHVFFNSSLYKKFVEGLQLDDEKDQLKTLKAYPEKALMGLDVSTMALVGANSFLRRHISKHLDLLKENKQKDENKDKMMIMTKQDQFRYELHLRLAIAMYALSSSMKPVEGESYTPLQSQFM